MIFLVGMNLQTQALNSRSAEISACGKYRYVLRRLLTGNPENERRKIAWIMLNPSTADATKDDPTIRRVVDFSRRWEFDDISVYNLFAYRATDPTALSKIDDPIGPENESYLDEIPPTVPVVAAWGMKAPIEQYGFWIHKVMTALSCHRGGAYHLGLTTNGQPRHPLMLPKSTELQNWRIYK